MAALLILPLLLIFTMFDFGGGTSEEEPEPDLSESSEDVQETPRASSGFGPGLLAEIGTGSTSDADDQVFGTAQIDIIDGQDGDDRLLGFASTDYLEGGAGDDALRGGDGNDVLGGGPGDDKLVGGGDHDFLLGGSGNDNLLGEAGNDTLIGGAGQDNLDGGTGNDLLFSYVPDSNGGADDSDREPAINTEHILAFDILSAENPDASVAEIETILSENGLGHEDLTLAGPDESSDRLSGGAGNDILFLGSGDDGFGGSGDDSFVVNVGNSGAAAVVWDYAESDDVLIVDYEGPNAPTITVQDIDDNAHVSADGDLVAIVLGTDGAMTAADVRLIRSG